MKRFLVLLVLGAATLVVRGASASDLHGNVAITSDYVFRGISQAHGEPVLQAGLRFDAPRGFYLAGWGSSLRPDAAGAPDAELDLVMGWSGTLGHGLTLDTNLTRYTYPGANRASTDYDEWVSTLDWRQRLWLQAGWSNDVFATGQSAVYTEIGGRVPMGHHLALEAAIGRYDLAGALGRNYVHGWLALAYSRGACALRLALHETDAAARRLFPRLAGPRVELSASLSY